jgi:hypothetical protein
VVLVESKKRTILDACFSGTRLAAIRSMTRPNPNQQSNEPGGARTPRDQPQPGDDRSQRSGSDRSSRDLDVIPEGEEEMTGKDHDEIGEDEDEALERESPS